ncbi:MAG: MFS transporter, partial [bacterium]
MTAKRPASNRTWLNGTVLGIGLASLFCDLGHEAVTSVLPAYLASLGASAGALGTVEGFADGLSSVAKLWGGWMADRLRRVKPLCTSGYAVMALSPFVIAAASSWPVVAAGRSLAWVSRGLRTPSRKVLLSDAVTPDTYGKAFGLERAMDTVGAILAPLAVLLLLSLGWTRRRIILLSALPAIVAALAIWFLVRERPRPRAKASALLDSLRGFSPDYKRFLASLGAFGLGDFADSFYILYAVQVLSPRLGGAAAASWSVAFYALHNVVY